MIDTATKDEASLIILPEMFFYPYEINDLKSIAEEKNETLYLMQEKAKKNKIYLCTGSIAEKRNDNIYNTSYLINPDGDIILRYSKCHLFDIELPDLTVKESDTFTKGNEINSISTELGKIGIMICYDIRFPEYARKLTLDGIDILLIPAAFNNITGPAHWDINFRTRALENQIFIAAASPATNINSSYLAYGHSMFIDPWGGILKQAGKNETVIYSVIDFNFQQEVKQRLPLMKHRRPELY